MSKRRRLRLRTWISGLPRNCVGHPADLVFQGWVMARASAGEAPRIRLYFPRYRSLSGAGTTAPPSILGMPKCPLR